MVSVDGDDPSAPVIKEEPSPKRNTKRTGKAVRYGPTDDDDDDDGGGGGNDSDQENDDDRHSDYNNDTSDREKKSKKVQRKAKDQVENSEIIVSRRQIFDCIQLI
jgi:hypothetical protein